MRSKSKRPMKRLLAKLPRSSSGSRELSASSRAAALPADIFEVSITGAGVAGSPPDESVRLADLALVSSAICFSGASSDDFIIKCWQADARSSRGENDPRLDGVSPYRLSP